MKEEKKNTKKGSCLEEENIPSFEIKQKCNEISYSKGDLRSVLEKKFHLMRPVKYQTDF